MADRTSDAVALQMSALGGGPFEIGVLLRANPTDGPDRMILRQWAEGDVFHSLTWLKAKNAAGAAIYIRPLGEHRFSLIDDLTAEALVRLRKDGFQPCCVVQTSPNNFQAWVNHGVVLPKELSTAAARALALRFQGDLGSADWRHFGRLAGMTNRKQKYQRTDNLFPFVRIRDAAPGLVYDEAVPFIATVNRDLDQQAIRRARQVAHTRRNPASWSDRGKTIIDFHTDSRYGGDLSRADLAYAVYALGHGISEGEIRSALMSRDLAKKGNAARIDDYIRRTLVKAAERITNTPPLRSGGRVRQLSR